MDDWISNKVIDWLVDWLIAWFFHWSIVINQIIEGLNNWLEEWMNEWDQCTKEKGTEREKKVIDDVNIISLLSLVGW